MGTYGSSRELIHREFVFALLLVQSCQFRLSPSHLTFFHIDMKTTLVFLLSACLIAIAANSSRTGVRNQLSTGKLSKTEGEIVVHQVCNPAATMEEISSLKRQVEIMKKELTLRLDKEDNKGKERRFLRLLHEMNTVVFFAGFGI